MSPDAKEERFFVGELQSFTDQPFGEPLDSPEVLERQRRRREQRARDEGHEPTDGDGAGE